MFTKKSEKNSNISLASLSIVVCYILGLTVDLYSALEQHIRDIMEFFKKIMELIKVIMVLIRDIMEFVKDIMELFQVIIKLINDKIELVKNIMEVVKYIRS